LTPTARASASLARRASLAHGAVVPYEGDYVGPVVNLAARLVDAARAGELLVTDDVARGLDGGRYVAAASRQSR
jgi:class 3 adenylate cyclase